MRSEDEGEDQFMLKSMEDFQTRDALTVNPLYLSCVCNRCGKNSLVVLRHGDDGYVVERVDSNCKHIKEFARDA